MALAAGMAHGAAAADIAPATPANADQITRGAYLAKAADCIACHTIDPAKPFAGGYPLATPFGTIYGPNITADKETGIGNWSDEDFIRALHNGIDDKGRHLYPAFPYASFTKLSREDVLAIKAYLFSLPPIQQKNLKNDLPFPLNQRWILSGWKLFNFKPGEWQDDAGKSPEWNRGAYLVEGLAHCQECHTPRNLTMGVDLKRSFGGAQLGGWTAFNITPDPVSGIGGWKDEEVAQYMKTGLVPGKASAAGGMAEAIEHSLQYLSDADLKAIVAYMRSVPVISDAADKKPRYAWGQAADDDADLRGVAAVSVSSNAAGGAELFSGNCASCHSASGSGVVGGYYPSLFSNSVVGAREPGNLLMVILNGVQRRGKDDEAFMPGFADHLNDVQIATLTNYILKQYGQADAPAVTPAMVKTQRQGGPVSPMLSLLPWGLAAAALIVVFILFSLFARRRSVPHTPRNPPK
jgi:mono/diheme cytochrome c family protein